MAARLAGSARATPSLARISFACVRRRMALLHRNRVLMAVMVVQVVMDGVIHACER